MMDFLMFVVSVGLFAGIIYMGHKSACAKSDANIAKLYDEQMARALASGNQGEIAMVQRSRELFNSRGK
jgi:hypothetical protein